MRFKYFVLSMLVIFSVGCRKKSALEAGRGLIEAGEYGKAIGHFKKALAAAPESTKYRYFLTLSYAMVDSAAAALDSYKELWVAGGREMDEPQLKEQIARFLSIDPYPLQRVTRNKFSEFAPRFMPDGKHLIYVSDRTRSGQIYMMEIGSTSAKRLAKSSRWDTDPAVSPKGDELVFASDRDGRDKELYLLNIKTKEVTKLTDNTAEDRDPYFSPDGKKIVFVSDRDKNWEVYVIDRASGKEERITKNSFWDGNPSFSPDGASILYSTKREGNDEICLVSVAGKKISRLTEHRASDMHPRFSPDGKFIVFYSNRDGDEEIYRMEASGKNVVRLTYRKGSDMEPSFDPSGRRIVFDGRSGKTWEIFIIDYSRATPADTLAARILQLSPADSATKH